MSDRAGKIRANEQFREVLKNGRAVVDDLAVLYVLRHTGPRLAGVTVPRRFGTAVARNRIRRLFWEAYRACQSDLEEDLWIVFIPRQRSRAARYGEILTAVRKLLRRTGLCRVGQGTCQGGGCVSFAWE